jgi:hypothetical protein
MGLLDGILGSSMDDPRTAATLQLAQGLLSAPKAMQGLSGGLLGYQQAMQQAKQQKAAEEMRAMQMQAQKMQIAQAKRLAEQQKQQDAFRQSIPSPQMLGIQGAMGANGGPTNAAAAAIPQVEPNAQMMHGALQAGLIDPVAYINSQRKDNTPMKLGAGEALIDPKTFKPIYTNPKEDATDPFVRLLKQSGIDPMSPQGQALLRQRLQKESSHQPGTQVSVNTGQKGLDNTLKLRGDFRSEPVYKAHQEMESAYSQIQQALKAGTPVGDLAGATKIMKLLDPGSVVRESELGMAMSATGLLDRVQNYASNIISGHKLTPQQRKEFQSLADALIAQSSHLYNAKRGEYGQIAQRNGLNVEDVTGAAGSGVRGGPSVVSLPGGGAPRPEDGADPLGLRAALGL